MYGLCYWAEIQLFESLESEGATKTILKVVQMRSLLKENMLLIRKKMKFWLMYMCVVGNLLNIFME